MTSQRHQLVRIVLSGLNDIEEWRLGDPERAAAKGYPREYPAEVIDDYGIVFVDVTIDADTGLPVCHEVNGPNAVGSDALTGDSSRRAENEARQALRRADEFGLLRADGHLATPAVTVHAHQHWKAFRTGGEFYPRVDLFAEMMQTRLPTDDVSMRSASETLGREQLSVVMGDVPSVAVHLARDPASGRFTYQGRPVIFLGNPNLLPELVRIGRVEREASAAEVDLRAFHAWRLVHLVHDKSRQQQLLERTGITPLRHFEAYSKAEALILTKELLASTPVVLKPNGTSGGTGVHVVVAGMTDAEIGARIDAVIADCVAKYGDNAEATAFPIRGFEFVRSTGYPMPDGEHLWDLRIAVLFEPGRAQVFPVSMRIAPMPFDKRDFHLERDEWVSNVSGRQGTLLKSGLDDAALVSVGMTDAILEQVFTACVRWTMRAWDWTVRGDSAYEDECELADDGFYPTGKFST